MSFRSANYKVSLNLLHIKMIYYSLKIQRFRLKNFSSKKSLHIKTNYYMVKITSHIFNTTWKQTLTTVTLYIILTNFGKSNTVHSLASTCSKHEQPSGWRVVAAPTILKQPTLSQAKRGCWGCCCLVQWKYV